MWDLSCRDWQDRIRSGRSLVPTLPLVKSEADMGVAFFDQLQLPDVVGTPKLADAAGDWFRQGVAALFGSYDPVEQIRHIREIFWMVPKGSSKTSYGAGLMMTALLMNKRPRAEFLFVGPTQAIADTAFSQAMGMIAANPELDKRFRATEHNKTIRDRLTAAKLKIKTFDLKILTGPKPAGVLLDEVHLLGKESTAAKVIRQLRGGIEKSPEGFLVMITTQSDGVPIGAFHDELMVARQIRDGLMPGRMLPLLYEFPYDIATDPAKWQDVKNWPMVMPNLGRSIKLPSLMADWETERTKGAAAIQVWASQHLNIEIGVGLHSQRYNGADYWLHRIDKAVTLEHILEFCEVVVIGIDGGGLDDLLALAVMGRHRDTHHWLVWNRTWMHQKVLEIRKSEAAAFQQFCAADELVIVQQLPEAFTELAAICEEVNDSGLLHQIGLDPMGVGLIIEALSEVGIKNVEGDNNQLVVGIPQGWQLNGAIKTTEVKLAAGEIYHGGQSITAWAMGNAKVEPKGNAITITKQTAGTAKIDPLMAIFNCVAMLSKNPASKESIFDAMARRSVTDAAAIDQAELTDTDLAIVRDPSHERHVEMKTKFDAWLDFGILQNIAHADFAKMKTRFERWQQGGDE